MTKKTTAVKLLFYFLLVFIAAPRPAEAGKTASNQASGKELVAIATTPQHPPSKKTRTDIPCKTETGPGDILMLADKDYFPALLDKIRGARASIDLAMFVFKTTKSVKNRPSQIIAALTSAAKWGVNVRVFLEKSSYDAKLNQTNQLTAEQLRNNGIKVIFDSPAITTHAKLVVIDGRYSFIGSHNFTNAALKYNNEMSLLIDDRDLARNLTKYMEGISRL